MISHLDSSLLLTRNRSYASRYLCSTCPVWPQIKQHIIQVGPIPHQLFPQSTTELTDTNRTASQIEKMHDALASMKNMREFIDDFLHAKRFKGSKIENDRVLYLVYRDKWDADDNGFFDRTKIDFISHAVWIDVVEWVTRRDDESKKQLMQSMSYRSGYENA